ncbi:MAG: porin family protein [Ginsengibacter sp.]
MKKTMILAATILFAFGAKAQTEAHFGIKGGMNASELHNANGGAKSDTKIGFHAGLLAHIHGHHSNWAIQPELLYSLEGAKQTLSGIKTNTNLSYLNVPVLVQYMFDNGFRIEAGPQVGFLMSAKQKTDNTSVDVKNAYKTTAFSIPVGVGYLTRSGLGFDARYSFGLSDLTDGGSKVRGNNFQFGLFYQFSDPKIKK